MELEYIHSNMWARRIPDSLSMRYPSTGHATGRRSLIAWAAVGFGERLTRSVKRLATARDFSSVVSPQRSNCNRRESPLSRSGALRTLERPALLSWALCPNHCNGKVSPGTALVCWACTETFYLASILTGLVVPDDVSPAVPLLS